MRASFIPQSIIWNEILVLRPYSVPEDATFKHVALNRSFPLNKCTYGSPADKTGRVKVLLQWLEPQLYHTHAHLRPPTDNTSTAFYHYYHQLLSSHMCSLRFPAHTGPTTVSWRMCPTFLITCFITNFKGSYQLLKHHEHCWSELIPSANLMVMKTSETQTGRSVGC